MIIISLRHHHRPLVTLAREFYPRLAPKDLIEASSADGAVVFMVGRHPFERLVSGFRDKMGINIAIYYKKNMSSFCIEMAARYSFHDKLGRKIIKKYRQNPPAKAKKARLPRARVLK